MNLIQCSLSNYEVLKKNGFVKFSIKNHRKILVLYSTILL